MFSSIAINEYGPMDRNNNYNLSIPNDYYLKLIHESNNDDIRIMDEDE
jgi:hypothetical protein